MNVFGAEEEKREVSSFLAGAIALMPMRFGEDRREGAGASAKHINLKGDTLQPVTEVMERGEFSKRWEFLTISVLLRGI